MVNSRESGFASFGAADSRAVSLFSLSVALSGFPSFGFDPCCPFAFLGLPDWGLSDPGCPFLDWPPCSAPFLCLLFPRPSPWRWSWSGRPSRRSISSRRPVSIGPSSCSLRRSCPSSRFCSSGGRCLDRKPAAAPTCSLDLQPCRARSSPSCSTCCWRRLRCPTSTRRLKRRRRSWRHCLRSSWVCYRATQSRTLPCDSWGCRLPDHPGLSFSCSGRLDSQADSLRRLLIRGLLGGRTL